MKRTMILISAGTGLLLGLFLFLYYKTSMSIWETLAITAGTICYHFVMRLLVGYVYLIVKRNRADYMRKWYQTHAWEQRFYDRLKVKNWKAKMPTFDPDTLNPELHSWDEIAQAMCQAELVHETIIVLSFLPVVASVWFGAFWVFMITSFAGACLDSCFVIMQRYNRPRVIKIARMEQIKDKKKEEKKEQE